MDTTAGIIEDLENYVNIPLLVDEVELSGVEEIKRLTKSVYGQTGRKKPAVAIIMKRKRDIKYIKRIIKTDKGIHIFKIQAYTD